MSRMGLRWAAWAAGIALATAAAGCDTVECGEGTFREGAECVPPAPVECGAGTVLVDGRCEIDPEALPDDDPPAPSCPEGTTLAPDGACLAPIEAGYPECDGSGDPPAPGPGCEGLEPGQYCVTGTVVDIVTGCAVPADDPLGLVLIDPLAAALAPDTPPLGATRIGAGGTFSFVATGQASQLAVTLDEPEEAGADTWTRSVTGVVARAPVAGETMRTIALATRTETREAWSAALGVDDLIDGGFLVGRVVIAEGDGVVPAEGVRISEPSKPDLIDCPEGGDCLRMFDAELTGFEDVGADTTTASGAFVVLHQGEGPLLLQMNAASDAASYTDVVAGANAGSGFHALFSPNE